MQIKELHIDTFGHVNNATYLELLELARWEIIDGGGYGIKKIQELKIGPTILEVNIKFNREIKCRENITIVSYPQPFKGKAGIIKQQILNSQNELCCEAALTIAMFDIVKRKIVSPNKEWLAATGL